METPTSNSNSTSDTTRGIIRWVIQMIVGLVIFGAILFLAAGRLNWLQGWAFLAMNALTQILSAVILIPNRPDMLAERSQVHEGTKKWDRVFAPAIIVFGTLGVLIISGLDARFGWSTSISIWLWIIALLLAFACQMFVLWAMASNPFFATTVRIQDDRGHNVVNSGPYQIVRHPGYFGSVIYNLLIPLALGSWWTYIPALLTILLLVLRTRLEDSTLKTELPGYAEYTTKVRYRLIPGIW